jgi:4'-phosphopantetheinyl transferase
MKMSDPEINNATAPDHSYRGFGGLLIPDLNSPVLIILKTEDIHLDDIAWLGSFLSEDETEKSRRFRFTRDRVSYITTHGLLRGILGKHLGISPEDVEITYNPFGRPSVSGYSRQVFFNLSHSSGISVLAFDPQNNIGVDVEKIDGKFEFESIVQLYFSKEEGKQIQSSEKKSRQRFYEIWTRKEAFLKAMGIGITENLQVDVLSERINGNSVLKDVSGNEEFLFRSMVFEQNFRITLAMGIDSGAIRKFVIRNNGNGLSIREA